MNASDRVQGEIYFVEQPYHCLSMISNDGALVLHKSGKDEVENA